MIKALSIVRSILSIFFQINLKIVKKQYIHKEENEVKAPNKQHFYLFSIVNQRINHHKANIFAISVKSDHQVKNQRQQMVKIIMSTGKTKHLNI